MQRSSWLAIALALLIALGIAAWAWYGGEVPSPEADFATQVEEARASNAAGLSATAAQKATEVAQAHFRNTYKDPSGFSFSYPEGLRAGSYTDPATGAETITVQDAENHVGIQVQITPWSGGAVTQEVIMSDLPQVGARDFKSFSAGGITALAFSASDANFGDSWQVWFTNGDTLFQASTYVDQAPLLEKVISTWRWDR